MAQTTFYIVGGIVVVLAILLSAVGLRRPDFPSKPTLAILTTVFVLAVVVTAAAAVNAARDEQATRLEEENREAGEQAEETAETFEEAQVPEGTGGAADPEPAAPPDELALGQQVFTDTGCGACHTLGAAESTGQIGPNLDETLIARDPAFIRESIVDPDASIADGFPPGTMPQTYGEQLSDEQLTALVTFVSESTSEN
jgi:mono/diheme cytochrome c family protein